VLLTGREPLYSTAAITVDTSRKPVANVVDAVLQALGA
jgi:hypothetical protein